MGDRQPTMHLLLRLAEHQFQEDTSGGGCKVTGNGLSTSQARRKGIPETYPGRPLFVAQAPQRRIIMEGGAHPIHQTSARSRRDQVRPKHFRLHRGLYKTR